VGRDEGAQQQGHQIMTTPKPRPAPSPGETRAYPVLPLRDIVVFPHMIVPLFVGREKSIKALEEVMRNDTFILLATQKNASDDDPATGAIFEIGTLASVLQLLKLPDGTVKVLVEGAERAKILSYNERADFYEANAQVLADEMGDRVEAEALARSVVTEFEGYVKLNKKVSPEVIGVVQQIEDYGKLADTVAKDLAVKIPDKQAVLETTKVSERLEKFIVADDVQVLDVASLYALLSVQGPKSEIVVSGLGLFDDLPKKPFSVVAASSQKYGEMYMVTQSRIGTLGFDFFVPVAAQADLLGKLTGYAIEIGGRLCGWQALEMARIQAGIPRFGADMDETKDGKDYGIGIPVQSNAFFLKGSNSLDWGMKNRLSRISAPPASCQTEGLKRRYQHCCCDGQNRYRVSRSRQDIA